MSNEKTLKTIDDFYPNYPGNKVKVYISKCKEKGIKPFSILKVYGMDDYGLVLEKKYDEYYKLKKIYDNLPEPITKEWLLNKGFTRSD